MMKMTLTAAVAAALIGATLLGGCTPSSSRGNEATVGLPNNTGQTIWRQSCGSYDNFGARLSVDQCGGGHGGPMIP